MPSTNVHDNCHQSSFHLSKKLFPSIQLLFKEKITLYQSNFYLQTNLEIATAVQTATNTDFFVEETKIYTYDAVCPCILLIHRFRLWAYAYIVVYKCEMQSQQLK